MLLQVKLDCWKNVGGREAQEERSIVRLSAEEKLRRAEARIKLLEAENEVLKKLEALERHKDNNELLTSSERFQLINQVVRKHELRRVIRYQSMSRKGTVGTMLRWRRSSGT